MFTSSDSDKAFLSSLLVSLFRMLVFTPCRDRFSSLHEALSDTIKFSQLSGRVHNSNRACIRKSHGNFADANWFTNPMKVLMCTMMLSPFVYFTLTIFLIWKVLSRAFFLSYKAKNLCHNSYGICITCYMF